MEDPHKKEAMGQQERERTEDESFEERVDRIIDRERTVLDRLAD
jgi:hypothetical protein